MHVRPRKQSKGWSAHASQAPLGRCIWEAGVLQPIPCADADATAKTIPKKRIRDLAWPGR